MRVLHMTAALSGGGVERLLYDYYSNMDREKIHFDFVKVETEDGILEQPLKDMGSKIYTITPLRGHYKEYCQQLEKILKEGNYDAIHCSGGYRSALALKIAKKNGIKKRIAQSHMANSPETFIQHIERIIATKITKYYATDLCACGIEAAKWMWGNKEYKKGNVKIIYNAINIDKFKFDNESRVKIRRDLNIEDMFVIGNIGRLSYQKNHDFLLDVFSKVIKCRQDVVLLLVGEGELENSLKQKAIDLGIEDKIKFLGVRKDVNQLLNALDLFVLPSRWEGLPVVLVELQANGLPAFISKNVTQEIKINNNILYLPLEKEVWVDKICNHYLLRDANGVNNVREAGYDVKKEVGEFYKLY